METKTFTMPSGEVSGEVFETANIVNEANKYKSKMQIAIGLTHMNAKSLMGMMLLSQAEGDTITISAEGEDEATAIDEFGAYIENCLSKKRRMA